MLTVSKVPRIHSSKTPVRIHFIKEWLDHRGVSQVELAEALDTHAGTVSKWCKTGVMPTNENLVAIAAFLHVEPNDLFHDPADDWIARLFKERTSEEKDRIAATIEIAFPPKKASNH